MKCNICKAELLPNHYYSFTKTYWLASATEQAYQRACDITINVCDACEEELMRMYRELREDVADHI